MPQRFYPGNIYHLFNRGNDRHRIFLEAENYRFSLCRLAGFLKAAEVNLLAYCLMPNHYHMLVQLQDETDFSNVLRNFTSSYVKSFNKWHGRVGHLFQSNTRAKLVDDDKFLVHVCRYDHLNPVIAGLVELPEQWEYSDYRLWIDENAPATMANVSLRRLFFSTGDECRRFVLDYAAEMKTRAEVEKQLIW
ncbi:MAG: transposase [Ignavibacteriales bacterium]|nr:transposase [Ignavibacteriales bacterium]